MIHLSLTNSLKKLFEMNGLFDATMTYANDLKNEKYLLTNVIQGSLWKTKTASIQKD